jgi:hypothetical protein
LRPCGRRNGARLRLKINQKVELCIFLLRMRFFFVALYVYNRSRFFKSMKVQVHYASADVTIKGQNYEEKIFVKDGEKFEVFPEESAQVSVIEGTGLPRISVETADGRVLQGKNITL